MVAERHDDADEIRGINSRAELAEVSRMLQQRMNDELMAAGVTLVDPATTYIDPDVEIGDDTVMHPCVFLEGRTVIGRDCEIHAGARIVNSTLGDRVTVFNHSVIAASKIGDDAHLGPFARIRPAISTWRGSHVGNFVELKKSTLGAGSKIGHLSYIGDCDGRRRREHRRRHHHLQLRRPRQAPDGHRRQAFVGSDSTLVAPVTHRRRRLRGGRLGHHRGRAGRRAGHRPRPAGEQGRAGRAAQARRRNGTEARD